MLNWRLVRRRTSQSVMSVFLAGVLLSACGRTSQSGPLDEAASSTLITAVPAQAAIVTLDGVIQQMAQERWLVGDTPILLDSQTSISGTPSLGVAAHIRGVLAQGALHAQTIDIAAALQPSPAAAPTAVPPTAAPSNLPAATPLPAGSVVNINGVIEQVSVTNNVTTIVVNSVTYVLPQNIVVMIGKQLRIGVPIVFVGQVDGGGQIVVVNVTRISNRVIVIKAPRHGDEDEDEQGDD